MVTITRPFENPPTILYLGNFARWDTTAGIRTGNYIAENAASVMTGANIDKHTLSLVQAHIQDSVPDSIMSTNDNPTYGHLEGIRINGQGPLLAIDSAITANITIYYDHDNNPNTALQSATGAMFLVQLVDGSVYAWPSLEVNSTSRNFLDDRLNIRSLTVNSVTNTNPTLDGLFYTHGGIGGTTSICFTTGTLIRTARGEVAVEELRVGDLLQTLDHGFQPLRWIGWRDLDRADLLANPKLCPIRIEAGALGAGLPLCDLTLSPQHRVLVRSALALALAESDEVLVPAKSLLPLVGVEQSADEQPLRYWHLLCDRHEILWANGLLAESLFTGKEALKSVSDAARQEIFAIFPNLRHDHSPAEAAARPMVKMRPARQLVTRIGRRQLPLQVLAA